jgi:hypothetical protein
MSTRSVTSKASNASSKMLEELASRSNAKYYLSLKLEFSELKDLLMMKR